MYTYEHEVKYYECDRMGVTHHSNYIRFMEEARVAYLDHIGYGFERIEADGVFSPVVSVACQYKHPTTFKDRVLVEVSIAKLSEVKIEFSYVMRVGDKVVCSAQSTHCFIEDGRLVVLSQRLPELYQLICREKEAQ
ncbi:MAG: acyl-CoA thioesterase [Bacteroidales bacterium]|nr:acyl-CoA thioesterase [Bacteroidales bacterium]